MIAFAESDINLKGKNHKPHTITNMELFYSWNVIIVSKVIRYSTMIANAVLISVNHACSLHSHAHDSNIIIKKLISMNIDHFNLGIVSISSVRSVDGSEKSPSIIFTFAHRMIISFS